jgi:predicted transcriptional regulator
MREEMGLTQAQLAEALEMIQPDISRLEHRDDHLISTLRKVVEAMGGELEARAKFGSKRFKVAKKRRRLCRRVENLVST